MNSALESLQHTDKVAFLESSLDYYLKLEESGKSRSEILRGLARVAYTHDENVQIREKAFEFLEKISEAGIPDDLKEECPNCSQPCLCLHKCQSCGFSFAEDFKCSFLEPKTRVCLQTKKECTLFGNEYESCPTFNGEKEV